MAIDIIFFRIYPPEIFLLETVSKYALRGCRLFAGLKY
jgi:hypothetical protein